VNHKEDFEQVVAEVRRGERFLLTTHQNPDGDALGSLLGMHELLLALGKDSVMFMAADEFPLPYEYERMPLEDVVSEPPPDVVERVAVFLDCGKIERMPVDFLLREGVHILNIDHHHDNTRFGTVNLVMPDVSCTAEIVYRLAHALDAPISPTMAEALYIGLITDTGRFMYENTPRRRTGWRPTSSSRESCRRRSTARSGRGFPSGAYCSSAEPSHGSSAIWVER
jgi:phosphoesterase RecJ-like protein